MIIFILEIRFDSKRRVKGIKTDVWSAPRNRPDEIVLYEWYFTTDTWTSLTYYEPQPILLIIYEPQLVAKVYISILEYIYV